MYYSVLVRLFWKWYNIVFDTTLYGITAPSGKKFHFVYSPWTLVNTGFLRLFTLFFWKIPTIYQFKAIARLPQSAVYSDFYIFYHKNIFSCPLISIRRHEKQGMGVLSILAKILDRLCSISRSISTLTGKSLFTINPY